MADDGSPLDATCEDSTIVLDARVRLRRAGFSPIGELEALGQQAAALLRQVACRLSPYGLGAIALTAHGSVWLSPLHAGDCDLELLRCRIHLLRPEDAAALDARGIRSADALGDRCSTTLEAWCEDFDGWLARPVFGRVGHIEVQSMADRYRQCQRLGASDRRARPATPPALPPIPIAAGRRVDKTVVVQQLRTAGMGVR